MINGLKKGAFLKGGFNKPSFIFIFLFFSSIIFAKKDLNLILISIDTLRYDYLSIVNPDYVKTPNLDNFSKNSIFFEYAFTTSPLTTPAHASVFTGLYPKDHGIRENLSGKLSPDLKLISEILKHSGYKTYGFVSSATLSRDYGFSKSFDIYDDSFSPCYPSSKCFVGERKGEMTIKNAMEKLKWDEKFFLFLHIYEPHFPYEPPEPYKTKYKNNLYAGEVEYSDFLIGEFLIFLKGKGLFENSIICIFSDHGEGLKDHGEATHGYLAYNSTLRIPLILYFPNCMPKFVKYPVSLIDLYPTLLNLLEVPLQKNLPGKDLLKNEEREIFFEVLYPYIYFGATKLFGLISFPYKFIYKKNIELYDIYKDPQEKNKLNLKAKILEFKKIILNKYVKLDKFLYREESDERKNLKSLGYFQSADLKKILNKDPDEVINSLNNLEKARTEYLKGNLEKALNLYDDLIKEFSESSVLWDEKGLVLYSLGRKGEAKMCFEKAIKLMPLNFNALINLANYYSKENKFKEAYNLYEKAAVLKPNDPDLIYNYATTCANSGDIKEAKILFKKYIELYPDDPERKKIEEFLKK